MAAGRLEFEIRRYGAADWRQVRDLRLEMLADSPLAFVEALDDARSLGDRQWRARAAQADQPHQVGLAGVRPGTGEWIGLARGAAMSDQDGRVLVFNVYVTPEFRGRGLADALLDRVEQWAGQGRHRAVYLLVHEQNARAIAFYRRRHYDFTGHREPYLLDLSQAELEMRLTLR